MPGKGLLNHSTVVEVEKSASEVLAILAKHKARSIKMDYDASGNICGLQWAVETRPNVMTPFTMPVNAEAVQRVLYRQYTLGGYGVSRGETTIAQAQRVAWRDLKDWIEAQMALVETEMVTLEQVLLPYVATSGGRTLFQDLQEQGFKLLGQGS